MVPLSGLEPEWTRCPQTPQACVSTNFTITVITNLLYHCFAFLHSYYLFSPFDSIITCKKAFVLQQKLEKHKNKENLNTAELRACKSHNDLL